MKVRGGLIHHWIGAAFLPDAKVDDVLDVIRDYDRYKDFYRPSVIESKVLVRNDSDEKFTMQLVNHEFFAKMALDADYRVTNVRLDHDRFYSVARTTRVQQLEKLRPAARAHDPRRSGWGIYLETVQHCSFGTPQWWGLYRDGDGRAQPQDSGRLSRHSRSHRAPSLARRHADGDQANRGCRALQYSDRCAPPTCPANQTTPNAVTVRSIE